MVVSGREPDRTGTSRHAFDRERACPPSGVRTPQHLFRTTRALHHEIDVPPPDGERVAAEFARMYAWLRADEELASACGFADADLGGRAEARRIADLRHETAGPRGTFTVTDAELTFFVRHAWMAADRCSGRQYATLPAVVRHRPEVRGAEDMLQAAVDHARVAMDPGGAPLAPRTVVTVLGNPTPPRHLGQLFLTEQLVRFAGYRVAGELVGDGGYRDLTAWVLDRCPELLPPVPGPFDVLPMIALGAEGDLAMGTCPAPDLHLVDIPWPRHPDDMAGPEAAAPEVGSRGEPFARWTAVPLQTNFALDIAGQRYAVLFSGWYVDEEIAVNLLAPDRYAWADRVSAAIHDEARRERLRHGDRLDEYRMAQIEIATLRAIRAGFHTARRKLDKLGPSQLGFGRFRERYRLVHGEEPPNDPGWTANRLGSRYRYPSHPIPHVRQTLGSRLLRHWLSFRSLRPSTAVAVKTLTTAGSRAVIASNGTSRHPDHEGRGR